MQVPARSGWLSLVFRVRGSELTRTRWRLVAVVLVACVVTFTEERHDWHPNLTPLPFSLIGVALGIFLGFRNNASYDRWWEGRKIWGALVNESRSFARRILTLIHDGAAEGATEELTAMRQELVYRVIAFVHALRHSLRDEGVGAELSELLSAEELRALEGEHNWPFAITQGIAERIHAAWGRGWIHDYHLPLLEQSMAALTDIQGACERIKSTPLPLSYTTLIHRITAVYCFTLPFGLVDQVRIFTPFVCAIIALAFFGLDAIGDEIEDPFGVDDNDLALEAISRTIEVNLRQRLGEGQLPAMLKPVDELLR